MVSGYSDPARLAWGTTVLSLASAMLLTESADAQQSQDALPTIQVTPPPRVRARPQPQRQVRRAPAPAATPAPAEPTQSAATGPGTGYQAASPGVSRIPTPLRDTPQTVNVVTQQEIRDRAIVTMEDALRGIPGITFNAGEGGQQGDSPVIRGFASRTDIFRDGVRDPGWYTRDLFSIDRVEVYKGPSAFAFGRGSTGGAINNVSKLPQGQTYLESTSTVATPLGYRQEVDASGKVGNVSARIAAMAQDLSVADRDHVETKRYGFAPSVAVDVTDKTKVTAWYVFQYEDGVPDYGHPYLPQPVFDPGTGKLRHLGYYPDGRATTPVPIPRNNWFGVADGPLRDRLETETHILTGKIEHEFMPDVKVTNTTRYFDNERLARPTSPRSLGNSANVPFAAPTVANSFTGANLNPANVNVLYPVQQMTIGRQHFQIETDNTLFVNQTDLNAKFNTFGLRHTLAAGVEYDLENRFQQRARGTPPTGDATNLCLQTAAACRTSLYFPADTAFGGVIAGLNPPLLTESTTYAAYVTDQVKLNDYFELLGAVRYDVFHTDFDDPGNALPSARHLERTDKMLSYRVGGVVHPTKNSSFYVAHGVSYNPSSEFGTLSSATSSTANALLDPEKNTTYEIGGKVDVLNERLSITGAMFKITKENLRIPVDPLATTAVIVLNGTAVSRGIEVSAAGRITDAWSITVGYSHLDTEIQRTSNMAELGRQLPSAPPDSFSLWTTYDVNDKWTVGGGALYQSDTFVNTTNTAYVPEFWRFDAMTSYKITPKMLVQFNLYNLTDELYYAQYYQGHAVPAAGRYASLSLRTRW